MNLLILHGPNLNLLGERPGDERGQSLDALNAQIKSRAAALGFSVKVLQSNSEGALLDALHAERRWAQGIIINPGALAHTSYVLHDALAAVDKPVVEVHLTDIRRRESWRRKSVIKDVCKGQVLGKGFDSYLIALDRFATGDFTGRKKLSRPMRAGSTAVAPPVHAPASNGNGTRATKTLGRKAPEPVAAPPAARLERAEKTLGKAAIKKSDGSVLTRDSVREKIADRLSGKLTPAGLATWARAKFLDVQRGAPAESGQRELLEDSLQSLTLSAMPASRLSEDQLIELMTQLEG
jgi:3-dehydroquinate dehydratase-2